MREPNSTRRSSKLSRRPSLFTRRAASECHPSIRSKARILHFFRCALRASNRDPLTGASVSTGGRGPRANGRFSVPATISLAITACVLADWVWYEAGRRKGDKVLHFMHRFTREPDVHDRRSKKIFAKYGLSLFLVAKFVPGLDAVTPPLAGTSCIGRFRFLVMDAAGAGLYTCVYGGLGYLFSNDLDRAAVYMSRMGTLLAGLAFCALCVYMAHKLVQRHRVASESQTVRIAPADPIE